MIPRSSACVLSLFLAASVAGCQSSIEKGATVPMHATPSTPVASVTAREATIRIEVRPSESLKSSLRNALPPGLASYVSEQASFGSGFLVRHRGKVRAVTNHHVVGSSPMATIVLDGDVRIEGDVLLADERRDIAIIAVSASRIDLPIVELDPTPVRVDDEVHASGYPGVGGEQSYRLTRGTVSDASWEIPHLDKGIAFVQHTAAIDPGSSGGPLFRRDTLRVVGVNTLKVTSNDNLYAAVPASEVLRALDEAELHERPTTTAEAAHRVSASCDALLQELGVDGQPNNQAMGLLSEAFVAQFGSGALRSDDDSDSPFSPEALSLMAHMTEDGLLDHLRPVAFGTLREALQRRLPADLRCGQIVDADLERSTHDQAAVVRVRVPLAEGNATFAFVDEQGSARLRAVSIPPETAPAPGARSSADSSKDAHGTESESRGEEGVE